MTDFELPGGKIRIENTDNGAWQMEHEQLVEALRRLSCVEPGYDMTPDDKEALRQAANEIQDVGAYADHVRKTLRGLL